MVYLIFFLFCDIGSIDQYLSTLHRDTSADNIQHGSLSGTITSHDRDEFSFVNRQVEVLK